MREKTAQPRVNGLPQRFLEIPETIVLCCSPPVQTQRHQLTIPGNAGIPWSKEPTRPMSLPSPTAGCHVIGRVSRSGANINTLYIASSLTETLGSRDRPKIDVLAGLQRGTRYQHGRAELRSSHDRTWVVAGCRPHAAEIR